MRNSKKQKHFRHLEIIDTAAKGKTLAKTAEGIPIFLSEGVPGDIVDIQTYRKRKGYFEGRIVHYHEESALRTTPVCTHFGVCGGCKWQHMTYEAQLQFKEKEVSQNLRRIGGVEPQKRDPILGCSSPYFYRNKMEFSFSSNRWMTTDEINGTEELNKNALGFHKPGMWDKIVDIEACHLQADPSNAIRNEIKRYALEHELSFFNPKDQNGLLRTLMIRNSSIGQLMVLLQVTRKDKTLEPLLDHLMTNFPEINSLLYVVNTKGNDSLYDQHINCYAGVPYIMEEMEGLQFKIGAKTFYQTNAAQAYALYKIVREFAQLQSDDIVYDLYTGIGTIAQFVAKGVKKVVGVDVVPESIVAANENAIMNGISNVVFEAGDMKSIVTEVFIERHGRASVVITDPPRDGMHKAVVNQLRQMAPQRIIYVSCNSATQARDLALLKDDYAMVRSQAVDMFPQTHHVETLIELRRT